VKIQKISSGATKHLDNLTKAHKKRKQTNTAPTLSTIAQGFNQQGMFSRSNPQGFWKNKENLKKINNLSRKDNVNYKTPEVPDEFKSSSPLTLDKFMNIDVDDQTVDDNTIENIVKPEENGKIPLKDTQNEENIVRVRNPFEFPSLNRDFPMWKPKEDKEFSGSINSNQKIKLSEIVKTSPPATNSNNQAKALPKKVQHQEVQKFKNVPKTAVTKTKAQVPRASTNLKWEAPKNPVKNIKSQPPRNADQNIKTQVANLKLEAPRVSIENTKAIVPEVEVPLVETQPPKVEDQQVQVLHEMSTQNDTNNPIIQPLMDNIDNLQKLMFVMDPFTNGEFCGSEIRIMNPKLKLVSHKIRFPVNLTSFQDLFSFTFQYDVESIKHLMVEMTLFYERTPPPAFSFRELELSLIVAARISDENHGIGWYRAMILDIQSIEKIEILFIDYSLKKYLTLNDIRRLKKSFAEAPLRCLRGQLLGVQIADNFDYTQYQTLLNMFKGETMFATLRSYDPCTQTYGLDLIASLVDDNDLAQKYILNGIAVKKPEDSDCTYAIILPVVDHGNFMLPNYFAEVI
jgi:hypothetical protein